MIDIGWKGICPPGRSTTGQDISEATLQMAAQTFNAKTYPVPVIPGHIYDEELEQRAWISQGSVPAYGQVTELRYDPGMLMAHIVLTDKAGEEVQAGMWLGASVDIELMCLDAFPPSNPAELREVPVLCHLALLGSNTQGISGIDSPNTWFSDLPAAALVAESNNRKTAKFYYTTPLAGWKLEEGVKMKDKIMLSADGEPGGGGAPAGADGGGESELQKSLLAAAPNIWGKVLEALTSGDTAAAQKLFDEELCVALEGLGLSCNPEPEKEEVGATPVLDAAQTATLEAAKETADKLALENTKLQHENDSLKLEQTLGGLTDYFDPSAAGLFRDQLKRGVKLETVLDNIKTTKLAMGAPRYATKPIPVTGASPKVKLLTKAEDYADADEITLEEDFKRRGGVLLEGQKFDAERYRKNILENPKVLGGGK